MSDFIREKIVRKTEAGRSFRNVVKIIIGAILFGVIAAGVFVLAMPYAQSMLGTEPESTTEERVTIPRDETEAATLEAVSQQTEQEGGLIADAGEGESEAGAGSTGANGAGENGYGGESEGSGEIEEETPEDGEIINDITVQETTAPVEDIVKEAMSGYDYSMDDLNNIWRNVAKLCDSCDSSIVTVHAKKQAGDEDDLFGENRKENSYSGVIIAETFNESMILTDIGAVSGNESDIEIEWSGGAAQQVYIRQVDETTGLAIVCARKADMTDPIRMLAKPLKLGNSYAVGRGDLLIAVGAPCGEIHSTGYTWAGYIRNNDEDVDGTRRLIYPSEGFDSEHGTWMLNSAGELVGWMRDGVVVGISGYKSLLEYMVNSADYPYMGIVATEIPGGTETLANAPLGIYVKDTVTDGPAYRAGILPGDIITKIKETPVHTMTEFRQIIETLRHGEEITVVVCRDSRGEYKEIEYTIEVGSR